MLDRPPVPEAPFLPGEDPKIDVLSDVLGAARLRGAVYFDVRAAAPWVAMNPSMDDIGRAVMPGGHRVIPFHVVTEGHVWVRPADRSLPVAPLRTGDVVMFPAGQSHVMSSDRNPSRVPDVDLEFYRKAARSEEPFTLVEIGGRGDSAQFVCGYLCCDTTPFNPLLASLPPMLISRPPRQGVDLIRELIRSAVAESGSSQVGTQAILARLSEMMFVQALRAHVATLSDTSHGWLAGLRNERVGHALQLMHARPKHNWSLTMLAGAVGLSRSRLAAEFKRYIGESPMRYLTRWRVQLASRLLAESAVSIAQAALEVGYESEAAFKRAFKKHVGLPVGQWRRLRDAPAAVEA